MADYQSVAPTTLALSLDDAKRQLNVTSDIDDDLITSYIQAATQMLEERTSRCFINQTRVLKMQTFADNRYVRSRGIRPLRSPIKSVSSISYVASDGTTTTMPSSDYIVSTGDKPGVISEAYSATWPDTQNFPNDVTVTYVAGHTSATTGVPERIKHAIRMTVAHWYRNRESVLLSGAIPKEVPWTISALLESEQMENYA